MAGTKISSAVVQDFSNKQYANTAAAQDISQYPSSYTTTAAGETTESEYQNTSWTTQNGAYQEISELARIIDIKSMYTVGKGFTADASTTKMLKKIRGNGIDSFNTILYNAVRTYTIGGDFYAEIIRNSRNKIVNVKPLNPSTVKVIANDRGIITGYEQYPIVTGGQSAGVEGSPATIKFSPKDIFHLAYNRIADQIHGQSVIDKLGKVIDMRRESMQDLRVVFHRYVKPLLISSVDTDDTTEINEYKAKLDNAMEKGENMVVPKGILDGIEKMSIPQFSSLDPLPWIKLLQNEFIKSEAIPGVVLGVGSDSTEAESKILYLAFQQVIEFNQQFLEEQIEAQLGVTIELEFPASIEPDLVSDEKKDPSLKSEGVDPTKDQK